MMLFLDHLFCWEISIRFSHPIFHIVAVSFILKERKFNCWVLLELLDCIQLSILEARRKSNRAGLQYVICDAPQLHGCAHKGDASRHARFINI